MRAHPLFLMAVLALAHGAACNCDPNAGVGNGDGGTNGDGTGDGKDGGGGGDGGEENPPPFPREDACHAVTQEANLTKKPVDVILVIDNSGSMTAEIEAVEQNVNVNFAQIIEQSGVDYRVILLAEHGSAADDQSVCIQAPLSGTDCNPIPPEPVNGARFFHYDFQIGSHDSLQRLLETYDTPDQHNFAPGGWSDWLRPGSVKTFIEITDDSSNLSADDFEDALFGLAPAGTFGDAQSRNYIFHSIIGIVANDPPTAAWPPTEPVKNQDCSSAANPGPRYEDLSIRTGGLRFPVCETSSYDAVFQAAAQDVIASATVSCRFLPPAPPMGTNYQLAFLEYIPGDGSENEFFLEVEDTADCNDHSFTRDQATDEMVLCPAACTRITTDPMAKIGAYFACGPEIG